jgi:hypothetical protein
MTNVEIARAYLDAVVAKDYEGVESLLADDFRLRDLSPPGFTEVTGQEAALSVHPEAGARILEQHHLLTIDDQQIRAIDELCTGFFAP